MKKLLTVAAIIVGCASSHTFAQTSPVANADKLPVADTRTQDAPAIESTDERITDVRSSESDRKYAVSAEAEQDSLKDRIAATKFAKPEIDGLKSVFDETLGKDAFTQKPAQATSSSDWQFGFAPYLFAAGISGTVGARGRTLDIDADFAGGVWENLDIGLMGVLEIRKGKLMAVTDFMWVKLSKEETTPGRFYDTAKLGINLLIIDPEVGYRVVETDRGTFDVLGGVRIWSVETNLNVTSGLLPGFDVSERKTWAAPVLGIRGTANVTPKFFLTGKADIGGFGWAADLTSQLFGAAGYRVHKNVALLGGYRWLQVEYDDGNGFLYDTQMHGLIFGAKFSF